MTSRNFSLRLSLIYIALFVVIGIYMPFFPVWLKSRGMDDAQIAIILSSLIGIRIISGPVFTFLADRAGNHRRMLIVLCVSVACFITALAFAHGFALILGLCVAGTFLWAPVMPMIEAYAVREAALHEADYGRIRLWGSISFIAAGLFGGVMLDYFNADAIIMTLIAGHILLCAAAVLLPPGQIETAAREADDHMPDVLRFADVTKLLATPLFVTFLLAAGLAQTSHAFLYSFGTLNWQSIGIPGGIIGMLWGIGVAAEVVLFAFSTKILRKISPVDLILIGALAGIVRWTITAHNPPLALLFAVQILHALTFGATHLGALHFINRAIPRRLHTTAQGVYLAIGVSALMAIATIGAGKLYENYGAYAFYVSAGISFLSAIAAIRVKSRWNDGRITKAPAGTV